MKRPKLNQKGIAHILAPLFFIVVFTAVGSYLLLQSHAQSPESDNSNTAVMKLPTHLMDGRWEITSCCTLTSISSDMSPKYDPSPDGYFYATEFYWLNNKTGYMGLQTESAAKKGKIIPKTVSATIYGGTGSKAGSSKVLAQCGNLSGEGYNCSLTDPYDWTPGHVYRFKMNLRDPNDGTGNSVWAFNVLDVTAGTKIPLGTIKAPARWKLLSTKIVDFHERFSGLTKSCSQIKPSSVVFTKVSGNDGNYRSGSQAYKIIGNGSTRCSGALKNWISNNTFHSSFLPSN